MSFLQTPFERSTDIEIERTSQIMDKSRAETTSFRDY
jgi:hypothetical protein